MLTRKQTRAVHDAVGRYIFRTAVKGPSYHPGARLQSEVMRYGAVAGDSPFWNKFCDLVDILKEIVGRLLLFNTWHPYKSVDLAKFTGVYQNISDEYSEV